MKFTAAAFLVALAVAVPGVASAQATTDLAKVEGGQFVLDKTHAKIIFSYSHFGYSTSYGMFTDFEGKLAFDPKAPAKSALEVNVNMNGIDTAVPKLDEHLKSADFFDVSKFPSATFKSTAIEVTGPNTGRITGSLTLHGVTKPVVLNAVFNGGGINPVSKQYVVGFNASGVIKRSEFGVSTYAPMVGDDVTLTLSGEFARQ